MPETKKKTIICTLFTPISSIFILVKHALKTSKKSENLRQKKLVGISHITYQISCTLYLTDNQDNSTLFANFLVWDEHLLMCTKLWGWPNTFTQA